MGSVGYRAGDLTGTDHPSTPRRLPLTVLPSESKERQMTASVNAHSVQRLLTLFADWPYTSMKRSSFHCVSHKKNVSICRWRWSLPPEVVIQLRWHLHKVEFEPHTSSLAPPDALCRRDTFIVTTTPSKQRNQLTFEVKLSWLYTFVCSQSKMSFSYRHFTLTPSCRRGKCSVFSS